MEYYLHYKDGIIIGSSTVAVIGDFDSVAVSAEEYNKYITFIERRKSISINISNLKHNLKETDFIVCKIAEAETEEEKQALREKYAEQLNNRKWWRAQINSLEIQQKQLTNQ